jgi:hypothetical protein
MNHQQEYANHTQSTLHFRDRPSIPAINRTFFILSFICFISSVHAQSIIAGQTSGANVHYFDIEDVYIYTSPNETSHTTVDLDSDNNDDIEFEVSWYIGPGSQSARSSAKPLNDTWISMMADHDTWVFKHFMGDSIDSGLQWSQEEGILYGVFTDYWGNTTASGEFNGMGFLAFRIVHEDTIIGWMQIDPSTTDLTISDYAFYAVYTGNETQEKETYNFLYNNPCHDQLIVNNPLINSIPYALTDIAGKVVSQGLLLSGNNPINIEFCHPGLYFLTVNEMTFKVVKM